MNREFVPYGLALELKQLGFDEPCFGWFLLEGDGVKSMFVPEKCSKQVIGLCLAPTFSQAFRFFREKHDLFISIVHYENGYSINDLRRFKTYEEAELDCLKKLIEIVKQ